MPEEEKTPKTRKATPKAPPENETLAEKIERIHGPRRKGRKEMVEARANRTRVGGSWIRDGKKLDPNGNDRKKGLPK